MTGCAAPNCSNHTRQGYKFYRFPADPDRREQWVINCGRENWCPTQNDRLCSEHFEESQFESNRVDNKKRLRPYAVPTLFKYTNSAGIFDLFSGELYKDFPNMFSGDIITNPVEAVIPEIGCDVEIPLKQEIKTEPDQDFQENADPGKKFGDHTYCVSPKLANVAVKEEQMEVEEIMIKSEVDGEDESGPSGSCTNDEQPSCSSSLSQLFDANGKLIPDVPLKCKKEENDDTDSADDDEECSDEWEDIKGWTPENCFQKLMERIHAAKKKTDFFGEFDESSDEEKTSTKTPPTSIYQFKVTLLGGIQPPVWRCIQIPASYTFHQFHIAIQKAMGWESADYDYHLHEFEVGFETKIGEPFDMQKDERKVHVFRYFKGVGQCGMYLYDLGFGWEHKLELEKIFEPEEGVFYPKCVDGQRACPPEDVGGAFSCSYEDFVDAINNPSNPEHKQCTQWLGRDHFDPEEFDPEAVF